jgi:hypothetical protein
VALNQDFFTLLQEIEEGGELGLGLTHADCHLFRLAGFLFD